MNLSQLWALALGAVLLTPAWASAEWSLNPFAKKSGPPRTTVGGDSGWSWWPGNNSQPKHSLWPTRQPGEKYSLWPEQPTMWKRMTNSTKRAWDQTADFLNPFDDMNDPAQYNPTGSRGIAKSGGNTSRSEGSSWFNPWPDTTESARPKTVNEFLKGKRPGFDD